MTEIKWQLQAAVAGGPSLFLNQPAISVGAYDVVELEIPDKAAGKDVSIQPSVSASEMLLVVISSDQYGSKLTYTVNKGTTDNILDGPHVFIGAGAVSFLDSGKTPNSLQFSNKLGTNAKVSVLVGRNVT